MVMRKQDVSFSKRLFVRMLVLLILVSGTSVAQNYPHRSDVLWVTTPDHNDWRYACGEVARVDVALYYYGMLKEGAKVHYEVGPELFPAREKGVLELKEGRAVLELGTLNEPGFLDCRLWVELDGERFRHHVKVGFDPHLLQPYTQLPDDFTAFWDAAKEKAAACPPKVEKEYVPAYSNELVDCFLVKLQVFEKGQFMYGYLTMPKAEGKYPVVIAPPGAGVKPMDPLKDIFYAEQGFIRFDMEIHGIRPDMDRAAYEEVSRAFARGGNSYLVNGLDDRDNYYMKKVYLGLMGAVDFLTTLPNWDGKNLMAQGGSQGGALALVLTALDKRITACAANHPALADMAGYKAGRAGGYPHFFTRFERMDTPEKLETMAYYDVVNFARFIEVPVFMTWGYNDDVCPPTTSYITYNVLTAPKEALITPVNEHWISTATRQRILDWLRGQLR